MNLKKLLLYKKKLSHLKKFSVKSQSENNRAMIVMGWSKNQCSPVAFFNVQKYNTCNKTKRIIPCRGRFPKGGHRGQFDGGWGLKSLICKLFDKHFPQVLSGFPIGLPLLFYRLKKCR